MDVSRYEEDETTSSIPVNLFDISYCDYKSIKNLDAGTLIVLKSGKIIHVKETMDVIRKRMREIWEEMAVIVLIKGMMEMEEIQNSKRKRKS